MYLLALGTALFVLVHLLPAAPALRGRAVAALGPRPYLALFSALSLLALALMVTGMGRAPPVTLWTPPDWGARAARLLMVPALPLLVAAYLPGNARRYTRHPMLWAVALWALAHLLADGDLAGLVLFGGLGAYALIDMAAANRRGAALQAFRQPVWRDIGVVLIGLALYVGLSRLHPLLFGVTVAG